MQRHKNPLMKQLSKWSTSVENFVKFSLKLDLPIFLFLFLLGLSISVLSTVIDFVISLLLESRARLTVTSNPHEWYFFNYILWIVFSLFMSVLAAASGHIISPHSSGSGIPEMKSILSGVVMREYLSWRTFCAKILGLIATFAAGFSVGKEGPFVHISACVSDLLMRIPIFKNIRRNDFVKNQLLAAACSAGVAATFGSPFGGVLFSIEVTSTYYPVGSLWKGVFTSLIGTFFFFLFRLSGFTSKATKLALFSTQFDDIPDNIYEYILFALLGVLCGLFGALLVWVFTKFVHIRQTFSLIRGSRYIPVLAVCFLTATLSFPLPLLKGSPQAVTQRLFSNKSISDEIPYLYLNLILSFSAKFLLTSMAIVLPLPCGLFTPIFVIGATLGRIFGEIVTDLGVDTVPGGYAVVGAAALASASTGTLSTAIILFELTGQLKYMLPVLLATCCAVGVSNLFNLTIYDTILKLRGLPYLALIDRREAQDKNMQHRTVQDIMQTCDDNYVSMESNIRQIEHILRVNDQDVFPLVDREKSMLLIGAIQRGNLEKMILSYKKDRADKKAPLSPQMQQAQQEVTQPMAKSESFLGKIKFLIRSPSYYKEQRRKKRQDKPVKTDAANLEVANELRQAEENAGVASPDASPASAQFDIGEGTEQQHHHEPQKEAKDTDNVVISIEDEDDHPQDDDIIAEDTNLTSHGCRQDMSPVVESSPSSFNIANVSILKEEDVHYSDGDDSSLRDSITVSSSREDLTHSGHVDHNHVGINGVDPASMANLSRRHPHSARCEPSLSRERASSFGNERPRFMADVRMMHEMENNVNRRDGNDFVVQIDPAPFQISVLTPMAKVYFLFSMLGLSQTYVVSKGKLLGCVTRAQLISHKG